MWFSQIFQQIRGFYRSFDLFKKLVPTIRSGTAPNAALPHTNFKVRQGAN